MTKGSVEAISVYSNSCKHGASKQSVCLGTFLTLANQLIRMLKLYVTWSFFASRLTTCLAILSCRNLSKVEELFVPLPFYLVIVRNGFVGSSYECPVMAGVGE